MLISSLIELEAESVIHITSTLGYLAPLFLSFCGIQGSLPGGSHTPPLIQRKDCLFCPLGVSPYFMISASSRTLFNFLSIWQLFLIYCGSALQMLLTSVRNGVCLPSLILLVVLGDFQEKKGSAAPLFAILLPAVFSML